MVQHLLKIEKLIAYNQMLVNLTKDEIRTIIEGLKDGQLKEKLSGIIEACICKEQQEDYFDN